VITVIGGNRVLSAARAAVGLSLCVAALSVCVCANWTRTEYPNELGDYTETVVVPGMGYTELAMKLAIYKAMNPDVSFRYTVAKSGQYTATFSGAKSNNARKAMYAAAADLRHDVYSLPWSDIDIASAMQTGFDAANKNRVKEAVQRFYEIAVSNPFYSQAVVMYGAGLGDLERYEDAITILNFVKDADGASDMIAFFSEMKRERDRIAAEEYARRMAEYQRQQEEENQRRYDELIASLNTLGNTIQQMYGTPAGVDSYGGAYGDGMDAGGGSGKNCSMLCANVEKWRDKVKDAERTKNTVDVSNAVDRAQSAKSDYGMPTARSTGSYNSAVNSAKRELNSAIRKASGCRC